MEPLMESDTRRKKQILRVAIFRDHEYWVAQCLEQDIGVQAKDLYELEIRLRIAVEAERKESLARHNKPFAQLGRAPQYFQDMWDLCSGTYLPRADLAGITHPDVEYNMVIVA